MDIGRPITLEDLKGLSPDEVIQLLDVTWTWPLDVVQTWLEDFYNSVLAWINSVAQSVYDLIKPLFDTVWDWIQGVATSVYNSISPLFNQIWVWIQTTTGSVVSGVGAFFASVWDWINSGINNLWTAVRQAFTDVWNEMERIADTAASTATGYFHQLVSSLSSMAADIASRVSAINDWFSNEFIDPFIDWLIQFPAKFTDALDTLLTALGNRLVAWFTHESPGFIDMMGKVWHGIWNTVWQGVLALNTGFEQYMALFDKHWLTKPVWIKIIETVEVAVITAMGGYLIEELIPMIGAALPDLGAWISLTAESFGKWCLTLLPRLSGWFVTNIVSLLGSGAILTLEATGKLEVIIDKYVTPAITGVFDQFEAMGPVSPVSGAGMGQSIGKLASFTVAGLAGMTLASEMLSPLKHIGMGHIAAIVYDLINYKTLTAAFMGVLAMVYITTPLRYYYNRAARPLIPNEMELRTLYADQQITKDEYADNMAWHGYPDKWINNMAGIAYRPLSAFLLSSLVAAGVMADKDIDEMVRLSGYGPDTGAVIKEYVTRSKTTAAKALSSSTAMSAYKVGLDDETAFRDNLATLGYDQAESDRLIISANMEYSYNYRSDLLNFYIDAYHRRDIEEPELRSDLATLGVMPDKIDLIVLAQSIKRLKAAAAPVNPAITIELETIREQRTRQLITADQEISAIVALNYELDYATAIAAQDTVKMTKVAVTPVTTPVAAYETAAGKLEVSTIRLARRASQLSPAQELADLKALTMPDDLAQAIVENDTQRLGGTEAS